MFAAPSSHKRRRASARGDQSRKRTPGRVVLNVAGLDVKGKGRQRTDQEARQRLAAVVDSHVFNHEMRVMLPCFDDADKSRNQTLATKIQQRARRLNASFYVARIPSGLFLNPGFVTQYVKTAALIALSTGHLDRDDVICLDGQGTLILNLTKDTYQVLGLTGRPSRFALGSSGRTGDRKSGPVERYIVEIPLLDPTFVAGKPGWQRVHDSFERWTAIRQRDGVASDGKWTFAFAAATSRQSIIFPSELVKEADIDQLELETQVAHIDDVWLPSLDPSLSSANELPDHGLQQIKYGWQQQGSSTSSLPWEEWTQAMSDFSEWVNLVQMDAEGVKTYFTPPSLPINSYYPPSPNKAGSVTTISIKGFLHPTLINELFTIASSSTAQWTTCSVSGFSHSPIRWKSHDPGWGLAFGAGRSPADRRQNDKKSSADVEAMDVDSDSGSDGDSDDDDDLVDATSTLPLHQRTGKKARQKRHRLSKRKGAMRKGEAERSAGQDGTNSGSAAGGEAGWGCVMFARKEDDTDSDAARLVWWENVQGDTRS